MKSIIRNSLILIITAFSFFSCNKDDDVQKDPIADYTVMLYGTGGGNLDRFFEIDFETIEKYGYSDRVQFVAEYKYSKAYQNNDPDNYGGTRLYTLTKDGLVNERVAGQGFRMDDPDNIADFIKESMRKFPAKHYILILNDHGEPFSKSDTPTNTVYPETDYPDMRAFIQDDNTSEIISIFELEEGLKRSGEKLDLIYFDCCDMNMIEYMYQIKDYTNYFLGSANAKYVNDTYGDYYSFLFTALGKYPDLKKAITEFMFDSYDLWGKKE